jgi:hypothetical protein
MSNEVDIANESVPDGQTLLGYVQENVQATFDEDTERSEPVSEQMVTDSKNLESVSTTAIPQVQEEEKVSTQK